jgi:crotonobetainyl-CoA:carnitine CoA-transferase CaiB-like acyl-CoA transferase
MAERALSDLKVVEYGQFISAPLCAKMMADLGAEVIKVEPPDVGDESRRYGPFPGDDPHPERSGLFLNLNTNKLGITLNLNKETGKKIFLKLIESADILVENNPPKDMKTLGIDYSSLRRKNERLIMTSNTPYGQTGPYRDYSGYDINIQTFGGVTSALGSPDREPLVFPLSQGHAMGAINAAAATMIAVFAREKTGLGQHVDISESQLMSTVQRGIAAAVWRFQGLSYQRLGPRGSGRMWPYGLFPCKDGYVSIMTLEDYHWKRFARAMGCPEWTRDPRFAGDQFSRAEHIDELDAHLTSLLMEYTKQEIFDIAQFKTEEKMPFVPVYNAGDLMEGDQLKDRQWFVEVDHPETGRLKFPGAPGKLSKTPWKISRPAPLLGEHNEKILCGRLGYSKKELVSMRRTGIV